MRKKTKVQKRRHHMIMAAEEMAGHIRGKISLTSRKVNIPEKVDVSRLRTELGFNQRQFAERFGFALSAVKDWEQGRRNPERSARILLAIISANPKFVQKTLLSLN